MSEYQYYAFQALDKPLNATAQNYIKSLSSRVQMTASSASFVYHYGNFRASPYDLMRDYFDAMLYIANWGSRQLMFRFPVAAISHETQENYEFGEYITWTKEGDYYILNIEYNPEENDWDGWLEGEGMLAGLVQIREDILHGDYRALYLAWLKVAEYESEMPDYNEDKDEDEKAARIIEPPVPAGLQKLNPALRNFMVFYAIDQDLVAAAAEMSQVVENKQQDYRPILEKLAESEKTSFLERLLNGERFLEIALKKRLEELEGKHHESDLKAGKRSIGTLLERSKILEKERQIVEHKKAAIAHNKHLDKVASQESALWARMPEFIEMKSKSGYDEMLKNLLDLRDLAKREKRFAEFEAKVKALAEAYPTRSGLQRRLIAAKLI